MSNVLVISPHPDDESIGCGGTIRRHVLAGDAVHIVFLTSGEQGGHGRPPEETARVREGEARDAAQILGVGGVEFWRKPDGAVRVTHSLIERLQATLNEIQPSTIYLPHDKEMHPDHRAAYRLVRRALQEKNGKDKSSPDVLMYEVWTPLQAMDHIEDISEYIQTKLAAIRAHHSQCDVVRFDDAVLGLNRYRGEMFSWPGGPYAEIFRRADL